MTLSLGRSLILILFSCAACAQQPEATQDTTLQTLLKEVHALRLAMEQNNKIGPRIQIALARIQLQEERVRNAARQLQDARERLSDVQLKRAHTTDTIKLLETQQAQTPDPNLQKQIDSEMAGLKLENEQLGALEQQLRTKETEASAQLLTEQSKSDEANDRLRAIEQSIPQSQQ